MSSQQQSAAATSGSSPNGTTIAMGVAALFTAAGAALAWRISSQRKEATAEAELERLKQSLPAVHDASDTLGLRIEPQRYIDLLAKLIGETSNLQNFPPELIPQEGLVAKHVLDALAPHSAEQGGPLVIEKVEFTPGRPNLIIKYPGTSPSGRTIGLIGSHMDVVPAVAENWERDPFHLTVEGDKLYGRGTTDCLGHVALVTCLMEELAKTRPPMVSTVVAVFIASEEATAEVGVGIDGLQTAGKLDELKNGTCLWIDASDSEPCMGTAGTIQWHLTATGKRFHSGLPHLGINSIELAEEAIKYIQARFYKEFPAHPDEKRYHFSTCSTMKPTQIKCARGSLNQIPPTTTISGDVRLTPFYSAEKVVARIRQYVQELNDSKFGALDRRGPCSKYELPAEGRIGRLEVEFAHELEGSELCEGVACSLDSPGFLAICGAVEQVRGAVKPYSICGSLPLVASMKASGFDLCITGFGKSEAYHAENEFASLADMSNAAKILSLYISKMEVYNRSLQQ